MDDYEIVIAGDGHGAIALVKAFAFTSYGVNILSDDKQVLDYIRPFDRQIYSLNGLVNKYIICSGYTKIIDHCVIDRNTILNIHPSLLPRYRGRHSLAWALLNGEQQVGYTIHLVDREVDTGDILYQYSIQNTGQTVTDIWEDFHKDVISVVRNVVYKYKNKLLLPRPQNELLASYYPKRKWEDCFIKPNFNLEFMKKFLQVMQPPYPSPQFSIGGVDCHALNYHLEKKEVNREVGSILHVDNDNLEIQLFDGSLLASQLRQTSNNAPVYPSAFLKKGDLYFDE